MSEKTQAAVVGNALLSFFPGVDRAMREQVQMALLFAQRSADDLVQNGLLDEGYDHYRRQLMFLGWDGRAPSESWAPDRRRRQTLELALARVGATAGEAYSHTIRLAADVLLANEVGLTRFETRALAQESFQLLPCRVNVPGYVDLVLYHQRLEKEQTLGGVLFNERVAWGARAELVRFNVRLFEQQFAEVVSARLRNALLEGVYEL